MKDFIRINTSDNVVVALNEINKGIILDDIEATKIMPLFISLDMT